MKSNLFKLDDGRSLHWYQAGEGAPLVLLHGWSLSAAVFREIAELLSPYFRLLIPDLPGHGKSDPPPSANIEQLAADLNTWLSGVTPTPVTVLGWSLGGMLTMELAARPQSPVSRIVLIGTTPRFTEGLDWRHGLPATQVRALVRNLRQDFVSTLAGFFSLAFEGDSVSRERLTIIRQFAVKQGELPDRQTSVALLNSMLHQDQRAALDRITQPVLIIHGDSDLIVPVGAGRFLAERLPQAELFELSATGHGPFLSQTRPVADRLREFC